MIIHFLLTFILCCLNLIPISLTFRRKYILPFTFLCIGLFMGLRYDYGLDYWNYYNMFIEESGSYKNNEFLFTALLLSFNKYYQFILVKSLFLSLFLYQLVKKYVPEKYYAVFIFIFMIHPSLIYTMITAERTCIGAMIFWIGLEYFYLRRKRIILFIITIIIASFFHTLLLFMIIIPIAEILFFKKNMIIRNKWYILTFLLFCLIASTFFTSDLFLLVTDNFEAFNDYTSYIDSGRFKSSNIIGVLYKGVMFVPIYYVLANEKLISTNSIFAKFINLSLCYYAAYFIGIESDGRFGIMLFPFVIICILERAKTLKMKHVLIMILPLIFVTLFNNYNLHQRMLESPWLPGNYITYKTIFDANFFE